MLTVEESVEISVSSKHGESIRGIAKLTGVSRNTVRRHLRACTDGLTLEGTLAVNLGGRQTASYGLEGLSFFLFVSAIMPAKPPPTTTAPHQLRE